MGLHLMADLSEAHATVLAHLHPHRTDRRWLLHGWAINENKDRDLATLALHALEAENPAAPPLSLEVTPTILDFFYSSQKPEDDARNVILAVADRLLLAGLHHSYKSLIDDHPDFRITYAIPLFMKHLTGSWRGHRVDIDVRSATGTESSIYVWPTEFVSSPRLDRNGQLWSDDAEPILTRKVQLPTNEEVTDLTFPEWASYTFNHALNLNS